MDKLTFFGHKSIHIPYSLRECIEVFLAASVSNSMCHLPMNYEIWETGRVTEAHYNSTFSYDV